ncbi:firelighter [Lasioglossum baleicum]|uniref:firelighter n=1 Tax=Lasioglossum baleicum TaxID=434251 RepID=UPI003FCDD4FD
MPSIVRVFQLGHLRLLYKIFILSVNVGVTIITATIKGIVPFGSKNLLGETVLITGAGHGIGRELAIQLGALGCIVVCWDTNIEANRSTIRTVSENGGEVYGFAVDVSKRLEVQETVKLMRKQGVPDVSILINNAAVLYHSRFLHQDQNLVEKTFNVNVLSQFWSSDDSFYQTIEALLPSMIKNRKGHIVCLCSMCGMYGVSEKVTYCSSKFAVRGIPHCQIFELRLDYVMATIVSSTYLTGLMEALHEELRQDHKSVNIRFTTVYPFYVNTGLARDPKYRFPYIFGVLSPEYVAQEVIKAIRRNYTEYTIPRCLLILNTINR